VKPPASSLGHSATRLWMGLMLSVMVAACGGGGGGGAASNPPPAAVASLLAGTEAVANAVTVFDASASLGPNGGITGHAWNYGDGQSGAADSHLYAAPGSYTAKLTVTDGGGASASTNLTVTVAKCSASGTQAAVLSPHPTVCVQTSLGEMVFEFYDKAGEAPSTASNFLAYVDEGFYNGTLFHRVVQGFVIQGGGYTTGLVAKVTNHAPILLENNNALKNWQYTLAMARTGAPNSATSQFFVNLVDNHALDHDPANPQANGYAVFGLVISGTSVVDAIGNVATASVNGMSDVPAQEVVIRSILRMP
jgi:cyclophilin family peptidyl-prolyl cis-trans isomerase